MSHIFTLLKNKRKKYSEIIIKTVLSDFTSFNKSCQTTKGKQKQI